MPELSKSNFFTSFKGKVLSAFGGLSLLLGLVFLVSYFLATVIGNFAFVIAGIASMSAAGVAGWWLSKQISEPLEKVVLTAKSLERGSLGSVPKTSGAAETDEILATLSRLSQQTQKLATQIDEISNGKVHGVLRPTSTADRLGNSLYNLVTKISSSVKAEKDFVNIRNSLRYLYEDFLAVKRGDLSSQFRQTSDETEDLAFALNYLLKELKDVVKDVQNVTLQSRNSAHRIQEKVHSVAQTTESKAKEIIWVSESLKQIPDALQRISGEMSKSNTNSILSLENTYNGLQATHENSVMVNRLRQQVQESAGRIQKLNERSQDIEKVAKLVEDLAHRTNMVAMNASIQATAAGEAGRGFIVVAEEVEKLAQRASNTNKQISLLNKSIQAEVNEVGVSLDSASRDAVGISRLSQQISSNLSEVEKHLTANTDMHDKLANYAQVQTQTAEKSFIIFNEAISEVQNGVADLYDSEKHAAQIVSSMQSLGLAVASFKLTQNFEGNDNVKLVPESFNEKAQLNDFNTSFSDLTHPIEF